VAADFPFVMKGVSTLTAGNLCYGETRTVEFPIRVDQSATGGFYQLKVENDYESSSFVQFSGSSTLNLFVSGRPVINALIVNSVPLDVYAGDTATITVKIDNVGSYDARTLNAMLTAKAPIEAKWAKSEASIPLLAPKDSRTADFSVEVPKDAESGNYPLNLIVSYLDENLAEKTVVFDLGLVVRKKALFETSDGGSDRLYANTNSAAVKIQLENTGTDTARKLTARILPTFPFSTDGSVRYVEELGPGKSAPLAFTVDVDKDANPGEYSLDLLVDFEDAQGKKFQDTAKVALVVLKKSLFRAVFLDYWFFWAIIVIAAAIIAFRKMRKKQHKK
jgi:hypothetical protein